MELEEAKERVLAAAEREKEKSLLCVATEVINAEESLANKKKEYEEMKKRDLHYFTRDSEGRKTVLAIDVEGKKEEVPF